MSDQDSSSCLPTLHTLRKAVFLPEHYFLLPGSVAANLRNLKLTVFAVSRLWKCLDDLEQDLLPLRVTLGSDTLSEPLICLRRNKLCFLLQNS